MQEILKATPSQLKNKATEFASEGRNLRNLTNEMLNVVSSNGTWQSTASQAYKKRFSKLSDDMNKMYRMIDEHSKDLTTIADQYNKTENENKQLANSLPVDVIV